MLALGVDGGQVMLVDEATGEVKWSLQAHVGPAAGGSSITSVSMSPNGRFVASVDDYAENWKLWDVASGVQWMVGAIHDGTGACICDVTKSGRRRALDEGCPVVAHTAGLRVVAFSPCGHRLATGGEDSVVILWDAHTGEPEHRLEAEDRSALSVTFSGNGARLASGTSSGSIHIWDVPVTGTLLLTITRAHRYVSGLQFSPLDTRILASGGGNDFQIHLWDVDSGEKIRSIAGNSFAAFSPSGRAIATASASSDDVHVVDAEYGALRLTMVGHQRGVYSASFSLGSGSKIASGSADDTCRVWDSSTGALLRTIEAGSTVQSVVWGRDWVRDTQRAMAFTMGHHPRLGAGSQVLELEVGVVRMILDRV